MIKWLLICAIVFVWFICAMLVWKNILDDVDTCPSRKKLRNLFMLGVVGTIGGPITAALACVVEIVLNIATRFIDRWNELKKEGR